MDESEVCKPNKYSIKELPSLSSQKPNESQLLYAHSWLSFPISQEACTSTS